MQRQPVSSAMKKKEKMDVYWPCDEKKQRTSYHAVGQGSHPCETLQGTLREAKFVGIKFLDVEKLI